MAGERSVRISFEAREELSHAVQKIDASLDQLKGSLATTSASLEGTDLASEDLENSLDEVGDEARQATVSMGTLIGASAGLQAAFASLDTEDLDFDIDPDLVGDGAASFDDLTDALTGVGDIRALPDDHPLREISRRKSMPITDVVQEFRDAEARLSRSEAGRIKVPVEVDEGAAQDLSTEASAAAEEAQATTEDINVNVDIPEDSKVKVLAELESFIKSAEGVTDLDININMDASDEVIELAALVAAMNAAEVQAFQTAASSRAAASSIDEMGDEAAESATEMGVLASVASLMSLNTTALSLNVGAFNIALANLATQIPILIALLGTLATVLAGVGGAALLAVTGISAIIAAGFVSELTRIEEEFSNIEDKAQALQAIMQSLVEVFIESIEPLTEMSEASEVFFNAINSLLKTTNIFAAAIADAFDFADAPDSLMSISEFMTVISDSWSDNIDDIIRSTKVMWGELSPILADLIIFFIEGFDDMTLFITKFTQEIAKIAPVFLSLLDFATQLIDLGATVLTGLMPVFVGLLSIGTDIARMFNGLNPGVIQNVAGMAALTLVISKVVGAMRGLWGAMRLVAAGTFLQNAGLAAQTNLTRALAGEISVLTAVKSTLAAWSNILTYVFSRENLLLTAQNSLLGTAAMRLWALTGAKVAAAAASALQGTALAGVIGTLWAYTGGLLAATVAEYLLLSPLLPIVAAIAALIAAGAIVVGVLGNMSDTTGGLANVLNIVKTALSTLINLWLNVAIAQWNATVIVISGVIKAIMGLVNSIIGLLPFTDKIGDAIGWLVDKFHDFIGVLTDIPDIVNNVFDFIAKSIEGFINAMPGWLKGVFGIEGEFSFQAPGEGLTVSRADVVSGAEDASSAMDGITGARANEFNYNEENINEVAQEINADPEDKESLKRVIKDAMEEAESFSRRQQGGS